MRLEIGPLGTISARGFNAEASARSANLLMDGWRCRQDLNRKWRFADWAGTSVLLIRRACRSAVLLRFSLCSSSSVPTRLFPRVERYFSGHLPSIWAERTATAVLRPLTNLGRVVRHVCLAASGVRWRVPAGLSDLTSPRISRRCSVRYNEPWLVFEAVLRDFAADV